MSKNTIEWTDRTWNPTRGCSRVSPGCLKCFAEAIAARFSSDETTQLETGEVIPAQPFHLYADRKKAGSKWTGKVGLIEEKLLEPLSWRDACNCFVNSMSDLFHENQPDEVIDRVFAVMMLCDSTRSRAARQDKHRKGVITFQVLTKRSERLLAYMTDPETPYRVSARITQIVINGYLPTKGGCDWHPQPWPPENVWLGVSVETQEYADERIPHLLATPAAKRFVSYEPALGPVDFDRVKSERGWFLQSVSGVVGVPDLKVSGKRLDWIIVGGESGPGARPFDIAWARQTVQQCKAAGVACFVKQLGKNPQEIAYPSDVTRREANNWQRDGWTWIHQETGSHWRKYLHFKDKKGGDMSKWPEDLRVREFPR